MKEKFGLSPNTRVRILETLAKYAGIERVLIYGSRAKGNYRQGSDIDLTLVAPNYSTQDLLEIENELEDLLLPYKIDLSLFHQIENPELVAHIQRIGVEFND